MTDKLKIRVEFEVTDTMQMLRPHRQFFGRHAVAEPLLVEVEWEESEDLYGCVVDESEGTLGRSARVTAKHQGDNFPLVVTPDPLLYGSDADRTAAGKCTFKKLAFGEWNCLNIEML